MSSDPKKPFDAPPPQAPPLLNKELSLDRRKREVPSFEELQRGPMTEAPTDPGGAPRAPSRVPTAPGRPSALAASVPTQPIPPYLQPRAAALPRMTAQPAQGAPREEDDDPVTRIAPPAAALLSRAAPTDDDDDEPVTRVGSPNPALLARTAGELPPPVDEVPTNPRPQRPLPAEAFLPGARQAAPPPPPGRPAAPQLQSDRSAAPAAQPARPAAAPLQAARPAAPAAQPARPAAPSLQVARPAAPPAQPARPAPAPPMQAARPAAPTALPAPPAATGPAAGAPPARRPSTEHATSAPSASRTSPAPPPGRPSAADAVTMPPHAPPLVPRPAPAPPPPRASSSDALTMAVPGPARASAPPARPAAPPPRADSSDALTMAVPGPTRASNPAARPAAPPSAASPSARSPLAPLPRVQAEAPRAFDEAFSDAMTHAGAPLPTGHGRGEDEATGVLAPRRAPPSPVEFAQRAHDADGPRVTPSMPSLGAVVPPGQASTTPSRAQPAHAAPSQAQAHRAYDAEPDPVTAPARKSELPLALPVPAPPPKAPALPEAMLVTQPGLPGPFARSRGMPQPTAEPERPASLPELPRVELGAEGGPSFGDTALRQAVADDTVTASPAALWRRLGAWVVDLAIVLGLVAGFLAVAVQLIAPAHGDLVRQLVAVAVPGAALAGLLAFVYAALFAFLWRGRTPGRLLLGIHLVDTTGHAPGPLRALVRAGLSLVSFALFLSGFWLALFDRHGQTLHDKLTRTFVVRLQDV